MSEHCQRCGRGKTVARVFSDLLNIFVCVGCALVAVDLIYSGPGILKIELIARMPCRSIT